MIAGSELIKRVSEKYGLDEATVRKVWLYLFEEAKEMLKEEIEILEKKENSSFFNGKMEAGVALLKGVDLIVKRDKQGDWKLSAKLNTKILKQEPLTKSPGENMILIFAKKSTEKGVKAIIGKSEDVVSLNMEGFNVIATEVENLKGFKSVLETKGELQLGKSLTEVRMELNKQGIKYAYFKALKTRLGRKRQSKALYL